LEVKFSNFSVTLFAIYGNILQFVTPPFVPQNKRLLALFSLSFFLFSGTYYWVFFTALQ